MLNKQITGHQFRQSLLSAVGLSQNWLQSRSDDLDEIFSAVVESGLVTLPCNHINSVFILPDRIALYTDIQQKRRSVLLQCLLDRNDETALVVDSFLSGKDALHFARLVSHTDTSVVTDWVAAMNPVAMSLTIKPIDDQYKIMLATLRSFVSSGID